MAKRSASVDDRKVLREESHRSEGTDQCKSANNANVHPPRIDQIIRALNLRARYELEGREGKAGSSS